MTIPAVKFPKNPTVALCHDAFSIIEHNVRQATISLPQDTEQFSMHALVWYHTYTEALRQTLNWAKNTSLTNLDTALLQISFGSYLCQMCRGINMSQGEIAYPADIGLDEHVFQDSAICELITRSSDPTLHKAACTLMQESAELVSTSNLDTLESKTVRQQFRKFTQEKIIPHAQEWYTKNSLIPEDIIQSMGKFGAFGITIPKIYGGHGKNRIAACIATEELARGHIGAGALVSQVSTVADLIMANGTKDQMQTYLPGIASSKIVPTVAIAEPQAGSDLGAIRAHAAFKENQWHITGEKTWVQHAERSTLIATLVRTQPDTHSYHGLSVLLVDKEPFYTPGKSFQITGMTGEPVNIFGNWGLKEYKVRFKNFTSDSNTLLGEQALHGHGFKQFAHTFENGHIQTAACAMGLAQAAFETSIAYAIDRQQFGQSLIQFPRVHRKLTHMAADIIMSRHMTYYAARQKDAGICCHLESGMAKLLAVRAAWSCADMGVQIHGATGCIQEQPINRMLCNARILGLSEGTSETQTNALAKRLLE